MLYRLLVHTTTSPLVCLHRKAINNNNTFKKLTLYAYMGLATGKVACTFIRMPIAICMSKCAYACTLSWCLITMHAWYRTYIYTL